MLQNVSQHLRGTNEDLAGGRAEIGKNDQAIRTLADAKTLNELAGTMIPLFGGGEMSIDLTVSVRCGVAPGTAAVAAASALVASSPVRSASVLPLAWWPALLQSGAGGC